MPPDLWTAGPGSPLAAARSWRLRLIRVTNLTIAADPSLPDLYRTRFEGAPPKVRVRDGVVAIEYGPRFRPADWGRQAAEVTLNPSVRWRIEAPRGLERLRADLSAVQLLGMEVQHATRDVEVTLAQPVGPVLLQFAGGASDVTIHRPTGTAVRVRAAGGASRVAFDDQFFKAVAGEAVWTTTDFDQAGDRYQIDFSRGLQDVVVDTVEPQVDSWSRRVLATVLFTDIVGSTERARVLGDQRWRELLDLHDAAARRLVDQEGGRLVKSTGDGILAVFDGPGRGIRCALALRAELHGSGIEIRAGLHTGELDVRSDDVGGIAVHIGARIMAAAGPGEVLVSRTVRDLVTGSGLALEDRGTHTLKGIADQWQLFAAS
ncbi:MAG TPA: adenylate/guanylate cyclase domain-containing protein [Actinomycetota bacterium]|nr:adenylate/guanylate cyclase domain-containing protein [Actinomycetota bacterium]